MKFCAVILCGAVIALSGCSHNVLTYSDGVGIETTMRPDSGNFGLTFRYGKILSVTARENTEVDMTGASDVGSKDSPSLSSNTSGNVRMMLGKQWNGYLMDAIKSGATPEHIEAYFGNSTPSPSPSPEKAK